MSFLPPVVMEIRANAAQFLSEQGKVVAAAKATASETEKAAQKEAAAARASAAEATRAAEQRTAAADTSAKAAVAATDRRIAAESKATEAQAKATQMQAKLTEDSTAAQQAAYDKQAAAAARAANAVELAAAKENEAQVKAAQAATLSADAQKKASDLQVIAAEKSAAAQEVAATRSKVAMTSVLGVANKISAVSLLAGAAVAVGATEMAAKFEKSTMLLVTAGGESMGALDNVRKGILDISTSTGTSAEQMSEGMYVMEKAGIRGAAGLAALKAAAQGAKDENVDLGIMTQALTDLLLDYNTKTTDAAAVTRDSIKYTNELVAASGAAKTTMTDFANSMSAVIPIASAAGISFEQVGGAIATMTQHGQTAQQSSQNLANLIMSLIRPNNLASQAMQQMGIDTVDLAKNLGSRGLSGTLDILKKAIQDHTKDGMVFTSDMKENKSAVEDFSKMIALMPPQMQELSHGLLDGSVSFKEYGKAAKDTGGQASATEQQFMSLAKAQMGVNNNLKAGKPIAETTNAAWRDLLGNVTAMRAAMMITMNDSREFTNNIAAIGAAGKKTGQDIATWEDMQKTLSIQMGQTKEMVTNLGIEMGMKLLPAAKDLVSGFTDMFHGLEKGNPVLWAAAAVIGGALLISTVNLTQKLILMGVAGTTNFLNLGKSAITMGSQFIAGFGSATAAASSFTGRAGTLGGVVSRMGPALTGAAVGTAVLGAAFLTLKAAQDNWGTNNTAPKAEEITKALQDLGAGADKLSTTRMDNLFKQFDSGALKAAPQNVNNLDDAIKRVSHEGFDDTMNKVGDAISNAFGAGNTSGISQVEDRFKGIGESLGKLVGDGQIDVAARSFDTLALKFKEQGKSTQDALDMMPAYKQALVDQAHAVGQDLSQQELLEFAMGKVPQKMLDAMGATQKYTDAAGSTHPVTKDMTKSLDDLGLTIDGDVTSLGKLYDAMMKTGMVELSARDAEFAFGDTLRTAKKAADDLATSLHGDMSKTLDETGQDFSRTTEAGKTAEEQFSKVMKAGLDQANALAHSTNPSLAEVASKLGEATDAAEKTAEGMGLPKEAAEKLTRSILQIPPGVTTEAWVRDWASKNIDAIKAKADGLDGREVNLTVKVTPVGEQRFIDAALGIPLPPASIALPITGPPGGFTGGSVASIMGGFTGGSVASIMGMVGGGVIPGAPPSAPNVDNILAMVNGRPLKVRSGEFITNEPATKANLPWLKASNAGLNLGQAMRSSYAAGYNSGPGGSTTQALQGGQTITNHVNVQTNATPDQIAAAISWKMRTQ